MAHVIGGFGVSHSPSMGYEYDKGMAGTFDPRWRIWYDGLQPVKRWLAAAKPDQIVIVYNDHLNHFTFDAYPTFALGVADTFAQADEGFGLRDFPSLAGDTDFGWHVANHLVRHEFDLTICEDMKLDHGIYSWLPYVASPPWPAPVLPLAVNMVRHPIPTSQRLRKLGHGVARGDRELSRRCARRRHRHRRHVASDQRRPLRHGKRSNGTAPSSSGSRPISTDWWRSRRKKSCGSAAPKPPNWRSGSPCARRCRTTSAAPTISIPFRRSPAAASWCSTRWPDSASIYGGGYIGAANIRNNSAIDELNAPVHALGKVEIVGHRDDRSCHAGPPDRAGSETPVRSPLRSSEPVGSSARINGGSLASARATATRWRWPPDSWSGRLLA